MVLILASLVALLIATPVLLVVWRVCAPLLDERLGLFTGRDLRLLLSQRIGTTTVGATIEVRAGEVTWRASHRDWLSETDLEATTRDGSACSWTVSHWPPRPWLPKQGVYITPTNYAAGALLPELLPRGVELRWLPTQAYRPGAIYDLAQPQKAHEWLEPTATSPDAPLSVSGVGRACRIAARSNKRMQLTKPAQAMELRSLIRSVMRLCVLSQG